MTSGVGRAVRKARRLGELQRGQRLSAAKRYVDRRLPRRVPTDEPQSTPSSRRSMIRFWASERRKANWTEVERHLEALAASSRDQLELFVRTGLENTRSPVEILSLARHPLSAHIVRTWLEHLLAEDTPAAQQRIGNDEVRDAVIVGAARLLLPVADAERAHRLARAQTSRYFQLLDSLGRRPVDPGREREPVRHRLIIVDNLADPAPAALLLSGCEQATVLVTSDPFGMADFSKYDGWVGAGGIHVEHTRTRITRFSAEYAELHRASARVAERVVAEVAEIPGVLHEEDTQFLAVDVADFLFFHALKVRAIETLLDDDTFDDVVVAIGDHALRSEFVLLLADLPRLTLDPRVEFVSVSGSVRRRAEFWRVLDTVLVPTPRPLRATEPLPAELIVSNFLADARRRGKQLRWQGPEQPGWTLLATLDNPAYNSSTAAYAAELADTRPVRILHTLEDATAVTEALDLRGLGDRVPVAAWPSTALKDNALVDLIQRRLPPLCLELRAAATTVYEADAAKAFDFAFDRLVAARIVPALLRQKAFEHRFETWRKAGHLPDAVVLTPHRDPSVGGLAAVARRAGVPSIALEPHMQDANYSRYLKIAADYYGVFSEYFVGNAVEAFGVPRDRVRVIGTPRLVAPPNYDRPAAQLQARSALTAETGFDFSAAPLHVVFFGQPSSWHQLELVWKIVVDATRKVGAHLFLKPHPEESPSRVRRYLEDGAAADVTLLGGSNNTAGNAVDLADIVVTTYSTAAVDAAIRETPVVSVADGDTRYPIDIAAIVDAPMARSVAELAEIFDGYVHDPAPLLAAARTLIERESHFVTGPGPNLRTFLDEVIARGADGLRTPDTMPPSLFLDGPHPVFPV